MDSFLPLYAFFTKIRQKKYYAIGIDEYHDLLLILQKEESEQYFSDPKKMLALCKLLWLKPKQNTVLFEQLFTESYTAFNILDFDQKSTEVGQQNNTKTKDSTKPIKDEKEIADIIEREEDIPKWQTGNDVTKQQDNFQVENTKVNYQNKPSSIYLNFKKRSGGNKKYSGEVKASQSFKFDKQALPINMREIELTWRHLKASSNTPIQTELIDVRETVNEISKNGFVINPKYQLKNQKKKNLITFIDHRGSMIAYNYLNNAFLETISLQTGIKNSVFYYTDTPKYYRNNKAKSEMYVYKNQAHSDHLSIKSIFHNYIDIPILIISDAGAATNNISNNRLLLSEKFIKLLYRFSRRIVWLNPLPQDRWINTSADIICELVDMFEANEEGLRNAMEIWNRKIQPRSVILNPQIINEL